jgi:chromosome segregation ATPase
MEKITMQINKKIFAFSVLLALTFLLVGCPSVSKSDRAVLKPTSSEPDSTSMSKRFQETAPKGQTAVDSAIELAKEHTKLSEEVMALQQKNQDLIVENRQLKDHIAVLEPELKQTKKELAEANDFLIEMRIELNNWKTDILGFRDEMRDADKAQLEALLKILNALGGEIKTEDSKEQDRGSTTTSPNEQSKPELKETSISGEPNE